MSEYSLEQVVHDWSLIGEYGKDLIDVDATLGSGQAFSWQRIAKGSWIGQVGADPYALISSEKKLNVYSPRGSFCAFQEYFQTEFDLEKVFQSFPPGDLVLERARCSCPRLRILKQDPWETLVCFLSSSAKPIVQIRKICGRLRAFYGKEIYPRFFSFPSAEDIIVKGPEGLKQASLGFRANFIWKVSTILSKLKPNLLLELKDAPTGDIRQILMELPGVGRKIADCVLLFGYGRLEVFPIDRWMERVLRTFYSPLLKRAQPSHKELLEFSSTYFGPFAGYAQQYLFYWARTVFWKKGGLWEYHERDGAKI
ncbi:3-methyladenine DNA glycosylase [Candidatus Methylacidiphilum infernorum]|uniref:DNA-(apurinic or apyrimidinic site) lyase n=1 Tax=Candidatus Methylacidiphilum infernorum TaxID=511746 RepID=A0ABX7PUL0_9BACT|nr:DNA glycosylase [Candidatus Methylacidiphilum infernorum]QSR86685.1 3-methyladenine DNA glycosylase [Candidatus Methylacidiphilum infernorum]